MSDLRARLAAILATPQAQGLCLDSEADRETLLGLVDTDQQRSAGDLTRTIFECRCCARSVGGGTDGSFDEPGWGRIDNIDGPDAICPRCLADPTALDDFREAYPNVCIRPGARP